MATEDKRLSVEVIVTVRTTKHTVRGSQRHGDDIFNDNFNMNCPIVTVSAINSFVSLSHLTYLTNCRISWKTF